MIKTPAQFVLIPAAIRPLQPADEAEYRQVLNDWQLARQPSSPNSWRAQRRGLFRQQVPTSHVRK